MLAACQRGNRGVGAAKHQVRDGGADMFEVRSGRRAAAGIAGVAAGCEKLDRADQLVDLVAPRSVERSEELKSHWVTGHRGMILFAQRVSVERPDVLVERSVWATGHRRRSVDPVQGGSVLAGPMGGDDLVPLAGGPLIEQDPSTAGLAADDDIKAALPHDAATFGCAIAQETGQDPDLRFELPREKAQDFAFTAQPVGFGC